MFRIILMLMLITSVVKAQPDTSLLYKAYRQQSQPLLKRFFEQWHNYNSNTNVNDAQSLIAGKLISAFFLPENLRYMDQYDRFGKFYNASVYLVLPDSVEVYNIEDSLNNSHNYFHDKDRLIKNVKQIRPDIPIFNKIILYQNEKYKRITDDFLQVKDYKPSEKTDYTYIFNERQRRDKFLYPLIKTNIISSWGFDLTVITYPRIAAIFFNKNSTAAIVEFYSINGGGAEALYKLFNGEWVFSSVRHTWME